MQNAINRVIVGTLLLTVIFFGAILSLPVDDVIIILNGLFFGTAAAILVAYGQLLWNAVLGVRPYDRVRQMTLGFFLCWVAYGLVVASSFYFRASGVDVNSSYLTAASRYAAVVAAVLQVTAPDFGLGIFHGRDRKVLYTGVGVGLAVAVLSIYAQFDRFLAG